MLHATVAVTESAALPARLEKLVRGLALPEGRRVGQPGHAVAGPAKPGLPSARSFFMLQGSLVSSRYITLANPPIPETNLVAAIGPALLTALGTSP